MGESVDRQIERDADRHPARWPLPPSWRGLSAGWVAVALPTLLFVVAFLVLPLIGFLGQSLGSPGGPLATYGRILGDEFTRGALIATFRIAFLTALLTALLGFPLALLIASSRPPIARVLLVLVLIPFWTSILVRSYAWIVLLGRRGLVNSFLEGFALTDEPLALLFNETGVLIAMIHILLPYMVLPIVSVLSRIDPLLLTAGESLGASPLQVTRRVLLPLAFPGIAAGFVLVFTVALGYFVTPALLGGGRVVVAGMLIHDRVAESLAWADAAAIGFLLLAIILGALWITARALGLGRLLAVELER